MPYTVYIYLETGSIVDRERTGRPKRLTREQHYIVCYDNIMDTDCETTTPHSTELLLQKFPGLKVSERTVARADRNWAGSFRLSNTVNL